MAHFSYTLRAVTLTLDLLTTKLGHITRTLCWIYVTILKFKGRYWNTRP